MVEMDKVEAAAEDAAPLTAQEVLQRKGGQVLTVLPDLAFKDMVQMLAKHSVGSLLVVDPAGQIVGILSERDVTRAVAEDHERAQRLTVADLMTRRVIIGLESDSVDSIMALMTERRIRHLPIISSMGKLSGILSIGDLVKAKASRAESVVRYLTDFITGKYPA